NLPK
ncbi:hypothetical protein CP8484711_1237B, partial [Chlamydia psittaci 84-8471/1]